MKREMVFKVGAVSDREFRRSYWGYNAQVTLERSFGEFVQQFGEFGLKFEIGPIRNWTSRISVPDGYPQALLKSLRSGPLERMVTQLGRELNKVMGESFPRERERKLFEALKNYSKDCQLAYLEGFLDGALIGHLLDEIGSIIPQTSDIKVGFTGKILARHGLTRTPTPEAEWIGQAAPQRRIIIITSCGEPVKVLLHEIGHLFGATHIEDVESVMKVEETETFEFDSENKERIRKTLMQILEERRGQSA